MRDPWTEAWWGGAGGIGGGKVVEGKWRQMYLNINKKKVKKKKRLTVKEFVVVFFYPNPLQFSLRISGTSAYLLK